METVKFEELQLDDRILRAVTDMGFEEASPIQAKAIPVEMEGHDIIGQAQTGTGKTAAFGIPLLQKIDPKKKKLQAIALCPTRELAIQVADEIRNLAEQSASTVGNIQEVTERVQTAVARLTTDAKRLLEFVGGDVTESFNDFEKMADNYNEDANYVEELVTDFSAASEQLLASVSGVVANIQEVTKAANDGAASTGSIAERVTNVDRQAEDMRVLMKQTQEASLMLRKDTKKFTVA